MTSLVGGGRWRQVGRLAIALYTLFLVTAPFAHHVFCYLIVPSVGSMLYADTIGRRLAIGWPMGTIVSALGVYLSLTLDLPTGATIVCTFGLVLVLMALVKPLVQPHAVS